VEPFVGGAPPRPPERVGALLVCAPLPAEIESFRKAIRFRKTLHLVEVSAEVGLVEAGAGVIPAAGGTREMTFRALEAIPPGVNANPMDFIQNAFVTVAMAKVATSAQEAQEMRYLRPTDRIVLARDRLTFEAKKTVLHLAEEGYKPPRKRTAKLPGPSGYATLRAALYSFRLANQVTDHDVTVASKLAFVMTGGNCSPNIPVDEQYLLDLEREAFLSLCGEEKTQARMEALLMTGKPLRN